MSSTFCANCGMELQATQRFCGNCGTKVEAPPVAAPLSWSPSPMPTPNPYPTPGQYDQKLYANQGARKNRLAGWVKLLLFPIVVSCLLASGAFYRFYMYNNYQQGSCTITDKQIRTQRYSTGGKHSHSYTGYLPYFEYTILTADGRKVKTSGYDAPNHVYFRQQSSAQAIVDNYAVGKVYSCWYNPANITSAVLVFQGYNIGDAIGSFFTHAGIICLCLIILSYIFYVGVYQPRQLMRRGVLTQGVVLRNEQRRGHKGRRYTVSIIEFQTQPLNPLEPTLQSLTVSKQIPVGTGVPVLYDPYNPGRNAVQGIRPSIGSMCFSMFCVLAIMGFAAYQAYTLWVIS